MAEKSFTDKQREIVARKMGFEGPMDMFDSYLKSSPADARKYGLITETFMAKGGMAKKKQKRQKYAEGGSVADLYTQTLGRAPDAAGLAYWQSQFGSTVDPAEAAAFKAASAPELQTKTVEDLYQGILSRPSETAGASYWKEQFGPTIDANEVAAFNAAAQAELNAKKTTTTTPPTTTAAPTTKTGPTAPAPAQVTAAQVQENAQQFIDTQLAPDAATQATAERARTFTAAAPEALPAAKIGTVTAAEAVQGQTTALKPTVGTLGAASLVDAAQAVPTDTAVAALKAAEGKATQIGAAPVRTAGAAELVTGPATDQARIEAELAKNVAAQGTVTEEMTVQGQLNKLLADFEAKNPPAWAASSMRQANAILSARGVGASSIAGQAIIQATLEAATPIAAADAQTQAQMGLQNLSNRQQIAVLSAQQRATFLGQEFDQAFQTRVINAAKVSDAANQTFNAEVQITLENARLTQTMDMANLSNRQAMTMATAAQIANLETANLTNRQQSRVLNAQAFLQMDMANLANIQQTELFKTQANIQTILSDTAQLNAAAQFNATSENQTNQFFAQLIAQADQFNVAQMNGMGQFNADQTNAVSKFNTEAQNLRDQFNAQNRLVIDQSNAQWRREIATANTAALNRANEFNATKAQEITMVTYNNQWQQFRDELEYSWRSAENTADRLNRVAISEIQSNASILTATMSRDAELTKTIASSAGKILGGVDVGGVAKGALDLLIKGGASVYDAGVGIYDTLFGGGSESTTQYRESSYLLED